MLERVHPNIKAGKKNASKCARAGNSAEVGLAQVFDPDTNEGHHVITRATRLFWILGPNITVAQYAWIHHFIKPFARQHLLQTLRGLLFELLKKATGNSAKPRKNRVDTSTPSYKNGVHRVGKDADWCPNRWDENPHIQTHRALIGINAKWQYNTRVSTLNDTAPLMEMLQIRRCWKNVDDFSYPRA